MTGPFTLWCVIPAKLRMSAKQRLAGALTSQQRVRLAQNMLVDVIESAMRTPGLAGVALVTADAALAQIGRVAGARIIYEPYDRGICDAVDTAALRLEEEGVGGMLVLPGDIPAVRPADIARILRTHSGAVAVTLVEAARDGGTNALAVSPPGVIPFRYGEKSAAAHRYEALCRGIAPGMLDLPRVSLDLDNPDDLQRFLALGVTTRTSGLLKSFRLRKETK